MQLKKLSIFITGAILLATMLSACQVAHDQKSTGNYEIYSSDVDVLDGADYLAVDPDVYPQNPDPATTTPQETTITVTLDGETYTLNYARSMVSNSEEIYVYQSQDAKITYTYYADNMQLCKIVIYREDMDIFQNMDQAGYEAWIRQFTVQFGPVDWSVYTPAYRTDHTDAADVPNIDMEYLSVLPEGHVLQDRFFFYHKYYQDLVLTDDITVRISFDGKFVSVEFDANRFSSYGADVDTEKTKTVITEYITANLKEGAQLQNIAFAEGLLTVRQGNVLCKWLVTTTVLAENGKTAEYQQYFLVDVPDV